MRYSIEQYDKNGFLNAPVWLWLGWLFLAKAWVIFIVAGASRDSGADILKIIYPNHSVLYTSMVAGAPALMLMWLPGLRHPDRKWVNRLFSFGKSITLLTVLVQLVLVVYQIYLESARFSWSNAVTLVGLLWLFMFVLRSRRVRDCFHSPLLS